jgi:thioredoxin reductase/NAD-dependent dihydropyrimidine dehydrogenase PreA subunit
VNGDVRRGRALLAGAIVAALATLLGVLLSGGPTSIVSPGPISALHAREGLGCADCHSPSDAAPACSSCHSGHESRRAGHRALVASGELGCADCHRSHHAESVTVESGALVHTFPLIEQVRCESCHRPGEPSDPAFHCFSRPVPVSLCFDEHRRVGAGSAARSAAAERARAEILLSRAGPLTRGSDAWLLAVTAVALGVVGFVIAGRSRAAHRRDPAEPARSVPLHRRLPVIDAARCLGCGACVDACPHDVLEVERFVAKVARPDACCGLVLCAERCPNGSLAIAESEPLRPPVRFGPDLESLDQPGVFLAGDVTGASLIRSAVEQGDRAARAVRASLAREGNACGFDADVVVVGAGPAGLAAGVTARALGLDVVVLEQGRLAESIRAFPRGKLVLDGGGVSRDLPLVVEECEKEVLVRRWLRTVRRVGLQVTEQTRVSGITPKGGERRGFTVEAESAGGERRRVSARRVIVAVGQRGSPRRLEVEVPPAAESKVHYFLSDARAFAGRRSVIVGLGDSAMEAAIALSAEAKSDVLIVYRGAAFKRGKRRNIERVERLVARGKIRIRWSSEVRSIEFERLTLEAPEGRESVPYDALFVFLGSHPDGDFLRRIGLRAGETSLPEGGGRR